jgi:hypothetical protein
MKQFLNDKELADMAVPTVRLRHHQMQLRRVLVSRAAQAAHHKPLVIQGVNFMNKKRSLIVGTGLAGMVALAIFGLSVIGPAPNVSAIELAQNSSAALSQMDIVKMDPKAAEYKKFHPYFVEWLQEAQKAPDLRVLNYNELVKAYPHIEQKSPASGEPLRVIDNPADNEAPNIRELRYLEFTVTDGDAKMKIIVGINKQNIPEAALTHIVEPGKPLVGA